MLDFFAMSSRRRGHSGGAGEPEGPDDGSESPNTPSPTGAEVIGPTEPFVGSAGVKGAGLPPARREDLVRIEGD